MTSKLEFKEKWECYYHDPIYHIENYDKKIAANKAIIEFMYLQGTIGYTKKFYNFYDLRSIKNLDWLMPVVEKINLIKPGHLSTSIVGRSFEGLYSCTIFMDNNFKNITGAPIKSFVNENIHMLYAIWDTISEFCIWYINNNIKDI